MAQRTKPTQLWFFILTLVVFIGYYVVDILNHLFKFDYNLTISFFLVLVDILFMIIAVVFLVIAINKKLGKLTIALPIIALVSILIPVFFAFQSTPTEYITVWMWIAEIFVIATIVLTLCLLLKDKLDFLKRIRDV